MSVNSATVWRIAHFARIKVADAEVPVLQDEFCAILTFVEELTSVDIDGVALMTSVLPMLMKKREDMVTDGGIAEKVIVNAPSSEDRIFVVPKVVE
jgi:aspartyl-tRNA(Asn)/glutamyl-tRNA(Gln) amidotransferase subunit C